MTFAWNASTDDVGVAFYDVYHDGQLIDVGERHDPVDQPDRRRRASPGACTSTPATPPATCRRPARRCRSRRRSARPTRQPPTAPTSARPASASGTTRHADAGPRPPTTSASRATTSTATARKVGTVTGTATTPPATTFIDSGLAANTDLHLLRASPATRRATPRRTSSTVDRDAPAPAAAARSARSPQIATDTDIPWGLVTLPDGTILYSRRDAHDIVRLEPGHRREDAPSARCPTSQSTDGEGGLLGLAIVADASPPTTGSTSCTPRRPTTGSCGSSYDERHARHRHRAGAADRHPAQQVPQRRPAALRPGRQALRHHRRRAERRQRAEHQQPQRQGPAAQPRRHASRRTTRSATTSGATATATRRAWPSTRRAGCGSRSSATPSWTRPT